MNLPETSFLAAGLMGAFGVKVVAVIVLVRCNRHRYTSLLEAAIGSWLMVQITVMAVMFLLSTGNSLTGTLLWLSTIAIAGACFWLGRQQIAQPATNQLTNRSPLFWLGIAAIGAVFGFLALRSLCFFDTTWDALVYGLPRLSVFAQRHSLFFHQPTPTLNLFVNEWNGELNSLYYVLLTGNDQASSFGGCEIWLFFALSLTWLARVFGASLAHQSLVGILVATTPVGLCLAMVVKGDLLAAAAFIAAVGWTLQATGADPRAKAWTALHGILACGMAAGSKIVMVPVSGLFVLLLIVLSWPSPHRSWVKIVLLAGTAGLLVTNFRYVANLITYGALFKRAGEESPAFNLSKALANLGGLGKGVLEVAFRFPFAHESSYWALNAGLGFLGFTALLWLLWVGVRNLRPAHPLKFSARHWAVVFGAVGSFLHLLCAVQWQPWAFRYFFPWMAVGLVALFVRLSKSSGSLSALSASIIVLLTCALNMGTALQRGEVNPTSLRQAWSRDQNARKLAFQHYDGFHYELFGPQNTLNDLLSRENLSVLIWQQIDCPIYPFFGINHRNSIDLVDSAELLQTRTQHKKYDMIVITSKQENSWQRPIADDLQKAGYELRLLSPWWRILVSPSELGPDEIRLKCIQAPYPRDYSGAQWWQWAPSRSEFHYSIGADVQYVRIHFGYSSIAGTRAIKLTVSDQQARTQQLLYASETLQELSLEPIPIHGPSLLLTFESDQPAKQVDSRLLSFSISQPEVQVVTASPNPTPLKRNILPSPGASLSAPSNLSPSISTQPSRPVRTL